MSHPFCESCNRIRLTADGKIKNCLFGQEEFDILTPFRNGEDIKPLILDAIQAKHKSRGGIPSFEEADFNSDEWKNRSMISIGG